MSEGERAWEYPGILRNENGVTIRELKAWLAHFPDEGPYDGEEGEVWIETGHGRTSPVVELCGLNVRDTGSDIALASALYEEPSNLWLALGWKDARPRVVVVRASLVGEAGREARERYGLEHVSLVKVDSLCEGMSAGFRLPLSYGKRNGKA